MFYTIAGVFLAFILALHGYRKGSLAMSGALAAFAVGCVIFNAGPLFTVVLIVFYASGSFVTGVKSSVKARLTEEDALMAEKRKHGNRTGWQVLSNSLFQALLAALHLMLLDGRAWPDFNNHYSSILFYSYLSSIACCMGDTFASELGILNKADPRLVTSWSQVPRGTNGAISVLGTLATILAGVLLTLSTCMTIVIFHSADVTIGDFSFIAFTCMFGSVVGMLLDSLLGATVQATYQDVNTKRIHNSLPTNKTKKGQFKHINGLDILTNNQVNAISSVLTGLIVGSIVSMLQ